MSIKIIKDEPYSRPAFTCDKCDATIQPDEGMFLWEDGLTGNPQCILVCHDCDRDDLPLSQNLETGLMYLLANSGYIDAQKGTPTRKLKEAFDRALTLS